MTQSRTHESVASSGLKYGLQDLTKYLQELLFHLFAQDMLVDAPVNMNESVVPHVIRMCSVLASLATFMGQREHELQP